MNSIPINIKDKVVDKDWNTMFMFEEIPCEHKIDAKEFEKINCEKCNFDKREKWLEDELTVQNPKETITENGKKLNLSRITVIRGKLDDCIAIQKEFS